jgi:cystathionine beta-lyase/cystathionine gamma-synthase
VLKRLGITTRYYDPLVGGGIADLIGERTRVVFTESPGSLTFEVQDVPAIAAAARARGVAVVLDNSWATPLLFPALAAGADMSVVAGQQIYRRSFGPAAGRGHGHARVFSEAGAGDVRPGAPGRAR